MEFNQNKINHLVAYCQGVLHKEDGKVLYEKYLEDIQTITPYELVYVQNEQLKMGYSPKILITVVDKLINVFYKPLSQHVWQKPKSDSFLGDLMGENEALLKKLNDFKPKMKEGNLFTILDEVHVFIDELRAYNIHLQKIENLVFPYLEKSDARYDGLKIMWSLHDDLRALFKQILHQLDSMHRSRDPLDLKVLNTLMGRLYFMLFGLVQKQELILFPIVSKLLTIDELEIMRQQSLEYGFSFIDKPDIKVDVLSKIGITFKQSHKNSEEHAFMHLIDTGTGILDFERVGLILDRLPIDITLVDENDKVAYFSRPKDRLFPRTVSVLGRDVRNCHPPESVHVVEEIILAFRNKTASEASFWIQMRGLFIHIQYFALYNGDGDYKGTLEVSQEISKLRALEGEKRLLQNFDK